jgi:hypothetical protein
MRHEHGEERRGGVQDRGEPRGDRGLAPDDQAEGQDVVEQPYDEEGAPDAAASAFDALLGIGARLAPATARDFVDQRA